MPVSKLKHLSAGEVNKENKPSHLLIVGIAPLSVLEKSHTTENGSLCCGTQIVMLPKKDTYLPRAKECDLFTIDVLHRSIILVKYKSNPY